MRKPVVFVGCYLLVAGITLFIRNVFRLDFSAFGVLMAEGLIAVGIYLLVRRDDRQTHFGEGESSAQGARFATFFSNETVTGSAQTTSYSVYFSSCTIVLAYDAPPVVQVQVAFGQVFIVLPPGREVQLVLTSAFGEASMPGSAATGFGHREGTFGRGAAMRLSGDCYFGSLCVQFSPDGPQAAHE